MFKPSYITDSYRKKLSTTIGNLSSVLGQFPLFWHCYSLQNSEKTKVNSYLNQSSIERSPLIHGQINLIKFFESNKLAKVHSKI